MHWNSQACMAWCCRGSAICVVYRNAPERGRRAGRGGAAWVWQGRTDRAGAAATARPCPRRGIGSDQVALPRCRLEPGGAALAAQAHEARDDAAVRPLRRPQAVDGGHG